MADGSTTIKFFEAVATGEKLTCAEQLQKKADEWLKDNPDYQPRSVDLGYSRNNYQLVAGVIFEKIG